MKLKTIYSDFRKMIGIQTMIFQSLPSSSDFLFQSKEPIGKGIIAFQQPESRGRFRRKWFAHPKNLSFSFAFSPLNPEYKIETSALWAGLAVFRALKSSFDVQGMRIKWPNDLLIENKKFCGILCESKAYRNAPLIVVGIGLNLNTHINDFPEELRHKVTSLFASTGEWYDMLSVYHEILNCFENIIVALDRNPDNREKFLREWEDSSGIVGQQARVTDGKDSAVGKILHLDHNGNLVLRLLNGEEISKASGEISLIDSATP